MHRAYIPEGLVGKLKDKEAYLLNCISWQKAIKKVKSTGYAPLRLAYLRNVMGHRTTMPIIRDCIRRELIHRDDRYDNRPGRQASIGYKVNTPWSKQRVVGVRYEDDEIDRRILTWQQWRIKEAIGGRPERQWVFDNLAGLTFRGGVKAVFASHAGHPDKLNLRIQSVGRIEDKDWWFSADASSGRIFHNAVTLPRDCRHLLLMDGQPVAETDIANCQPFLLGAAMYDGPSEERTRYMELCINGGFYEHLNGLFDEPIANRDALKKAVYQNIMYGRAWHTTEPAFKAFRRGWPILAEKVAAMKVGKGGHSRLPVMMQSAEAEIMIGKVIPRVMREMPEVRAVTIHDSLLLPARHAQAVAAIVSDEFRRQYGVSPPVRTK